MRLKYRMILIGILLLLFFMISYLVHTDSILYFDNFIYNLISPFICNKLTTVFKFVTNFADKITIITLCILSLVLIKNKWVFVIISIDAVNSTIINRVLKMIFIRPRPEVLRLVKEGGYSFPSGHTMAVTSFYGFLIYLTYKSNIDNKYKIPIYILLSLIIILVGLSRIYLGVHYASDVLAGYIVSIIHLTIYITILEKLKKVS